MEVVQFKQGDIIAKKNDTVKKWYIIQQGNVVQKNHFVETELGTNSIIGILEQDFFICDYIAKTDCVMIPFDCHGVSDLKHFLENEAKMRELFLRTSMVQRYQQFRVYDKLSRDAAKFTTFIDNVYEQYQTIGAKARFDNPNGPDINNFEPLNVTHKLQQWEIDSCASLMVNGIEDYMKLYTIDDSLCVGAIMETSAQMHRVAQGISEMIGFFKYNKELLVSDKKRDLLHSFINLEIHMKKNNLDCQESEQIIEQIMKFARVVGIYEEELLDKCLNEYEKAKALDVSMSGSDDDMAGASSDLEFIINYAGYVDEEKEMILSHFSDFSSCYGDTQKDETAYQLKKHCIKEFYEIYKKCFFKAVEQPSVPTTIEMFLNFGYMDKSYLDEDKIDGLFSIATHMELCQSDHVFTMFDWLKKVYQGDKEPSKNEFDMDFGQYLLDEYKQGNIQKSDIEKIKAQPVARTEFEIDNMFKSVNRITYGNITNFSCVLNGNDLFNDPDKMLTTRDKIYEAINMVRVIDYSAFYRPIYSHGLPGDMKHESLMQEILPDIILMPNAGTKAMMWQETASVKNDTPARFMIPIFTGSDLNELMIELIARYRWEICRKIQGVRWNDIREHSLTSDYYDYLQFYRKNHDLSPEAKEQLKTALSRAKNNFREVFVKDYLNWIKYESKGGFRLNKVVRMIMFTYCPFSKDIRGKLLDSPMYTNAIHKFKANNMKTLKRLQGVYDKYEKEGGEITPEMKENINFYEM